MNVLDLSVFNAIQSLQYRRDTVQLETLVESVQDAFHRIPPATIDKCFLTLQKVMACITGCGGGNEYKLSRVCTHFSKSPVSPLALPISKEIVLADICMLEN